MKANELIDQIRAIVQIHGDMKITHPLNEGEFKVHLIDENSFDESECRRQKIKFKPVEIYIE